jgi:hypothetical protein
MPRKSFSEFDLASALEWVGILETEAWEIPAATKEPSAFFAGNAKE